MQIPTRRKSIVKIDLRKLAAGLATGMIAAFCMPFSAYADNLPGASDELYDGSFYYELNADNTYTIIKCSASIVDKVPSIRNGTAITAIGEKAFANCSSISHLELPDSITTIGANAFYGCVSLKEVTLPKKLKSLGDHAFFSCSALESIDIPETLTEVPEYSFALCDNLANVTLPDTITSIGDYAFYQCGKISSFKLPASLKTIGDNAMGSWFSIKDIDVSANSGFVYEDDMLMDNNKNNIYRASSAKSGDIVIPDSVQNIRSGAFSTCAQITSVRIPSSVTDIGDEAFSYCSAIKKVDLSEGLKTIGFGAFLFDQKIESLSIPTTVETIDENAFAYCMKLNRLILPEGIKKIGKDAFLVCDELKQVSVPKTVTEIGDDAFGYTVENSERQLLSGFKLSVFSGSAGEKYAKSEKIEYTVTDVNIKKIAFIAVAIGLIVAVIVFALVLMKRGKKLATAGARKAEKAAKEKEAEMSYEKIMPDDDQDK